jgi:tetratricopeptide (TPR) repeat protein
MLGRISIEKSKCSRKEDQELIHKGIQNMTNGYGEIHRMISTVMEQYLIDTMHNKLQNVNEENKDAMEWCMSLAVNLRQQSRPAEALAYMEKAVRLAEHLLPEGIVRRGHYMGNLANIYSDLGRHIQALNVRRQVLALFETEQDVAPGDLRKAEAMRDIAGSHTYLHQYDDALDMLQSAIRYLEQCPSARMSLEMQPPFPHAYNHLMYSIKNDLAGALTDAGRYVEAMKLSESVLAFQTCNMEPNHPEIADTMHTQASVHAGLGNHKKALELEIKVLEFRRRVLPADHSDIAIAQYNCSMSYKVTGNFPRAMECAREAVRIWEETGHTMHPFLMHAKQLIQAINEQSIKAMKSDVSIRNLLSIDTCPFIGSAWQKWLRRRCACLLFNRAFIAQMRF